MVGQKLFSIQIFTDVLFPVVQRRFPGMVISFTSIVIIIFNNTSEEGIEIGI